jgi:hypothetical protein
MAFRRTLILVLLGASAAWAAPQDSTPVTQDRVKAAFLYKFASYVEWPGTAFASPDSPIVIGVAGASPMSRELRLAAEGRQVAGRPLQVLELQADTPLKDCCHILFVGAESRRDRAAEWLANAKARPILTVTDAEEHPAESVINFLVVDNRVRFDISRDAAERKGLQLRSPLLAVARHVMTR